MTTCISQNWGTEKRVVVGMERCEFIEGKIASLGTATNGLVQLERGDAEYDTIINQRSWEQSFTILLCISGLAAAMTPRPPVLHGRPSRRVTGRPLARQSATPAAKCTSALVPSSTSAASLPHATHARARVARVACGSEIRL